MIIRWLYFAVFIFSVLNGCIYIPMPEHGDLGTRGRLEKTTLDPILAGKTTREEVLLQLGEPDFVDGEDRIFVYHWSMVVGYLWVWPDIEGKIPRQHFFLIEFDDHGIVKRYELKEFEGIGSLDKLDHDRW